jgi:rhamnosyltransferase
MNSSQIPFVSVIFLTRNGGSMFRESLQAVLSQETNFPFEIVAVDSGSNDGTLEFLKGQPVRLHSISPDSFNFGTTRDLGFSLGTGEILVTLSQDAVPAGNDWLRHLCEPFEDPCIAAVQGREVSWSGRDVFFWNKIGLFNFTRETQAWGRSHQGVGLSFVNCAVRRSVWEANRLDRVEMSEDKVFQKMLTEQGHRIVKAREAKVRHSHQYDRKGLVKRCKNEGMGWRNAGMNYSRSNMILDMFHPLIFLALIFGLVTFQVRTSAEFLFPWIRPICLYEGNHSSDSYIP